MRLEGDEAGSRLREVWISLNQSEAERLREALDAMLTLGVPDRDWHVHVTSDDSLSEVTLGWQADEPPSS